MAYQQDFNEDQNKDPNQSSSGTVINSSTQLNAGPGGGTSSSGTVIPTANKPRGSGFTNLSQYVEVNKPQAQAMANQVTSTAENKINQAQQQGQQFASNLNQQAQQNTVQDQGVINQLKNHPASLSNQDWVEQYKKNTQGYTGPQNVESQANFGSLQNSLQSATDQAKALQTSEGRQQASRDIFGKQDQNYTRGENALDAFLLGSAGSNQFGQLANKLSGNDPMKQWTDLMASTNKNLAQAKAISDKTKAETEAAAQGRLSQYNQQFDTAQAGLNTQNQQNASNFAALQNQLTSNDPTVRAQGFQRLGIDANVGEWLVSQGYNPLQMAQQGGSQGLGDVVNQSDIQGFTALNQLLGGQQRDFTKTGNQNQAFNPQTGNIEAANQAFNLQNILNQRLGQQQQQRDAQLTQAMAALSPLQGIAGTTNQDNMKAAQALGMNYSDYVAAKDAGLLNTNMLTQGAKLGLGDVSTQSERDQFSQLMGKLGLQGPEFNTSGGAGAFNFDASSIQPQLQTLRANKALQEQTAKENQLRQNQAEIDRRNLAAIQATGSPLSSEDIAKTSVLLGQGVAPAIVNELVTKPTNVSTNVDIQNPVVKAINRLLGRR